MTRYISLLIAGLAIATLAAFAGGSAKAAEYPWCAQYGGRGGGGGRNCGFTSFNQCMATVRGIGGFCVRNQFYQPRRRH
ncbi:MAG: DUF3551 domain-containing protein [Pseudolabrys sp.]